MQKIQERANLIVAEDNIVTNSKSPFIEANTKNVSLSHLKNDCTIPVFSKDNECTIAHQEFINITRQCAKYVFSSETILQPEVRTSHIVKGRIPSAIGKPVKELQENEKTIYYERMAFSIEIPTIKNKINGNDISLVLGGVRAYNQENLYSKKNYEKFKFFIGFRNMVCTNLCVSSDGYVGDLRATNINELYSKILDCIGNYEIQKHLSAMKSIQDHKLTERQFAQLIGRCRMYNYLPKAEKQGVMPLLLNDGQLNAVAKNYYEDENFSRDANGDISLWNFYNLLTGSNKSSYIDTFLERGVNAHDVTQTLAKSLQNKTSIFYLN